MTIQRRQFLRRAAALGGAATTTLLLPPALERALAIPAHRRTGTIQDVEHIVILMQENRSFDHYFGTLRGVRGFADRFPVPVADRGEQRDRTVWYQSNGERTLTPFPLDTTRNFAHMRVSGTPHTWPNATLAWGEGKLDEWPKHKRDHSLGYYGAVDLPFQFAMAEAFTICDAYHCAFQGGTNPNRCFQWTGTNDALGTGGGPVLNNDYDNLEHDPQGGYTYGTYAERLEAAGISWAVYQDMADNFTDNPLAGFRSYRAAVRNEPGAKRALADKGLTTRAIDALRDDVIAGRLPQVSWIVATAEGSEHPGPSSPAQGAEYTAAVLDALTADPEVWSRTVLFVNFDENDGFFDHVPPPAAPSYVRWDRDARRAVLAGASTVDTRGEYHELLPDTASADDRALLHRPYGLGPRVPMYVVSPWSKGGWVNSEVFDHTSVLRFIERRFGVQEPNISAFRRAVCGDLTSAFNFRNPDDADFLDELPETLALAERTRALGDTTTPETPDQLALPAQELGVRPSRALPYELQVHAHVHARRRTLELAFVNTGRAGAVFHVYDRNALTRAPRRYVVEAGKSLTDRVPLDTPRGAYDLWVLGPNGFHRHVIGDLTARGVDAPAPEITVRTGRLFGDVSVELDNAGDAPCTFVITPNAYARALDLPDSDRVRVGARRSERRRWPLRRSAHWYDFTVRVVEEPSFVRRFAGRVETGRDSLSDPAMGGFALGEQWRPVR